MPASVIRAGGDGGTAQAAAAGEKNSGRRRAPRARVPFSRARFEERLFGVLRWAVIALLALVTLVPFYYMLLLSLKPIDALLLDPGRLWVSTREFTLSTYEEVLRPTSEGGQGFLGMLRNSALASLGAVVLTLLAAIPGSYAVSRLRFFGGRQLSALFLAVYLFPATLLAVPLFVMFAKIGLQGSIVGLAIVYIAQTVPVSVYMLRNYFATIPVSVEEAAALDGCSRLQTVRKVVLPLAAPSLTATGLYIFMIAWNEFLFALLFLAATPENWTVSLGLQQLANGIEVSKTVLMAGSVVLTVPVVLLFLAAERLLTEGLTSGADKS
ncbi:carbohydrate ABC transporter permease [Streptomyces sp. HNM0575]|nr:carbohydrate ABC transporter permease [Streptomyces sp. HNM0575]